MEDWLFYWYLVSGEEGCSRDPRETAFRDDKTCKPLVDRRSFSLSSLPVHWDDAVSDDDCMEMRGST